MGEANKADDEARKALIEARNEADTLIYSTEKSLKEHGDKLSEEDKTEISNTIDLIKEKVKALEQAALKIGQSIYGQGGAGGGAPEDGAETTSEGDKKEDVQDAEFKEKKDEEKKKKKKKGKKKKKKKKLSK